MNGPKPPHRPGDDSSSGGGRPAGTPDPLVDVVAETGADTRAGDAAADTRSGDTAAGSRPADTAAGTASGTGSGTAAAGFGAGTSADTRVAGADSSGPGRRRAAPDLAAELAEAAADLDVAVAAAEVEVDLEVAAVARERDEYLDALRRLQADFENYRKRMEKQRVEHVERAAGELVTKLLPVCDTVDLAIAHGGGEEVKQVWTALFEALERAGLERIDPVGAPFDPTVHDAVAVEPGEEGDGPPEVVEVMRAGYRWKGRVLRPAMVKVKG